MNHLVQVNFQYEEIIIEISGFEIFLVQQTTLWSDWTPVINPTSNDIITEKRTRFVCSIGSQIKSDSIVYRICNNQERTDCQETGKFYSNISNEKQTPLF